MPESAPRPPARIFISYRREEAAYPAGWLYDRLRDRYAGQVFKDVDSIRPGDDFVQAITEAVASCHVLLALIGDEWLTITDATGRRRLDDRGDFVRVEIEAALSRDVLVIPILIGRASMPQEHELPAGLAKLVRRQALELSPNRFDFDTGRLFQVLDSTLADMGARNATTQVMATASDPPEPMHAEKERQPRAQPGRVGPPEVARATAVPSAARPPNARGDPPESPRRRGSGRAWALAAIGVAVVAVVTTIAVVLSTAGQPLFSDDFATQANGWQVVSRWTAARGGLENGGYRISVPPDTDGAAADGLPTKAPAVFAVAPPNVRVEVDGRRAPSSDQHVEYGVLCRVGTKDRYIFDISDGHAKIMRVGGSRAGRNGYEILSKRDITVDASARNRVRAECTNADGQPAVHLALWVNGDHVVDYTDARDPLLSGTVGVFVATTDQATSTGSADFDDFVVSQL